jgi:glutamate/tyrosine decarboxylase-like PLP-dependent enzyme
MNHAEVLQLAQKAIDQYLRQLHEQGVGKSVSPLALKEQLNLSLTAAAQSDFQLQQDLQNYLKHAVGTLDPHFMNQLFSGLQPWALAGEMLAVVTNTTMATYEASPVATLMERELVQHLCRFAGWKTGDGIMVTGGSNANLVGLLMARNKHFPDYKKTGVNGARLVAFVSEEAHYSFGKAANIMGLGTDNIRAVAADEAGRMSPTALKAAIQQSRAAGERPFFVAATAGTTVLGEFDPIDELSVIAREEKLWLHVDGAWGGSVLLSRTHRHLMKGIENADSLGWDTHKMLGTGLVSSFFLTPHSNALRSSHGGGGADYIFHASDAGSWDLGPSSLQCGRKADAIKVWFAWRALGDNGLEAYVDTLFANAQTAATLVKQTAGLELVVEPTSLNVCFRVKRPQHIASSQWHRMLREHLMKKGLAMVNMATRRDDSFIRLITAHPGQNEKILKPFLTELMKAAEELSHQRTAL